ncbi:hypothetical protein NPIL_672241 [Nephila pilipes]|uniref:Uncharacterized protein n=1 Tax=Nephila pilipes TaxID=299642 RepID=A0A8X6NUK1_NEPPI|nr:hypothetical protein NPIL_672241 [Nephila pilipes]
MLVSDSGIRQILAFEKKLVIGEADCVSVSVVISTLLTLVVCAEKAFRVVKSWITRARTMDGPRVTSQFQM